MSDGSDVEGTRKDAQARLSTPALTPISERGAASFFSGKAFPVDSIPHPFDLHETIAELETLGFETDEALRLARLRAHVEAQGEYAEHRLIERRLQFVRWLIANGRIEQ